MRVLFYSRPLALRSPSGLAARRRSFSLPPLPPRSPRASVTGLSALSHLSAGR
jgi:hypothetical protein